MKKWHIALISVFLGTQVLLGCGGKAYSIIDRTSGPGQITIYAEAPTGASQSDMEGWAKEIEASEGGGRPVMINFYNGGRGAENMIGSYQGGTLYRTR